MSGYFCNGHDYKLRFFNKICTQVCRFFYAPPSREEGIRSRVRRRVHGSGDTSLQFFRRLVEAEPIDLGHVPTIWPLRLTLWVVHECNVREIGAKIRTVRGGAFRARHWDVHVRAPGTVQLYCVPSRLAVKSWRNVHRHSKWEAFNYCIFFFLYLYLYNILFFIYINVNRFFMHTSVCIAVNRSKTHYLKILCFH